MPKFMKGVVPVGANPRSRKQTAAIAVNERKKGTVAPPPVAGKPKKKRPPFGGAIGSKNPVDYY